MKRKYILGWDAIGRFNPTIVNFRSLRGDTQESNQLRLRVGALERRSNVCHEPFVIGEVMV